MVGRTPGRALLSVEGLWWLCFLRSYVQGGCLWRGGHTAGVTYGWHLPALLPPHSVIHCIAPITLEEIMTRQNIGKDLTCTYIYIIKIIYSLYPLVRGTID